MRAITCTGIFVHVHMHLDVYDAFINRLLPNVYML